MFPTLVFASLVALGVTPAATRASAQSATSPAAPQGAAQPATAREAAPTEQQLGLPVIPGAQFLRSYDAGRGQRYYLFGTDALLEEVVAYYRTALKQRGDVVVSRRVVIAGNISGARSARHTVIPGRAEGASPE